MALVTTTCPRVVGAIPDGKGLVVCGKALPCPDHKGNFSNDRHALYVGWVFGLAVKNGLGVEPVLDADGNYTDRLVLTNLQNSDWNITIVIPPPPDDWVLT